MLGRKGEMLTISKPTFSFKAYLIYARNEMPGKKTSIVVEVLSFSHIIEYEAFCYSYLAYPISYA